MARGFFIEKGKRVIDAVPRDVVLSSRLRGWLEEWEYECPLDRVTAVNTVTRGLHLLIPNENLCLLLSQAPVYDGKRGMGDGMYVEMRTHEGGIFTEKWIVHEADHVATSIVRCVWVTRHEARVLLRGREQGHRFTKILTPVSFN